jgi:hypothetical protein
MYLRYLVKQSREKHPKRIVIWLRAIRCAQTKDKDVIQAIQEMLLGAAADANFLQSLIYSGEIDICIDGLNEVNTETRSKISNFVGRFKGNIILTTQPLRRSFSSMPDWVTPLSAETYKLQPLREAQIKEFLLSRPLSPEAKLQKNDYEDACSNYLSQWLGESQSSEKRDAYRSILSNPIDLVTVSEMLAENKAPDLFSLQKQLYKAVAEDYKEREQGRDFPLEEISKAAYQMRLEEMDILPKKKFDSAIATMQHRKMVISQQSKDSEREDIEDWRFRHEKIADFFIVHTFLGNGEEAQKRQEKHIGDLRFRGIYSLLASELSENEAGQLREKLLDYGKDTGDYSTFEEFDTSRKIGRSRTS